MKNNTDISSSPSPLRWKGYDLNQLEMRRAVNLVRIEVERQRLAEVYEDTMQSPAGRFASSIAAYIPSIISISTIAFSTFRSLRALFGR